MIAALPATVKTIGLDRDSASRWLNDRVAAAGKTPKTVTDPITLIKARKHAAEIEGVRAAHVRDGAAVVRFLAWLASRDSSLCLFATAPDVVADHKATVELSLPVMPLIRGAGYKAAFVAQDGFDGAPWSEFDALFIGGSTKFKLSQYAAGVISEANRLGKWTHMGRVNSYERLRYAEAIGCDSVDGTYLKFGPDVNTPKLERWLSRMAGEPQLSLHI